jgi:hypothetical protein
MEIRESTRIPKGFNERRNDDWQLAMPMLRLDIKVRFF